MVIFSFIKENITSGSKEWVGRAGLLQTEGEWAP